MYDEFFYRPSFLMRCSNLIMLYQFKMHVSHRAEQIYIIWTPAESLSYRS